MKLIDVTVSRLIPGPAGEVFDVWLDPACPGSPWYGAAKIIVHAVVDGLFFWGHEGADKKLRPHYGRFLVLQRGKLAEYTWMSESTNGLESTVSISFEPRDNGTQVTIVHRGLPDNDDGRGHERGWTYLLDQLAKARS